MCRSAIASVMGAAGGSSMFGNARSRGHVHSIRRGRWGGSHNPIGRRLVNSAIYAECGMVVEFRDAANQDPPCNSLRGVWSNVLFVGLSGWSRPRQVLFAALLDGVQETRVAVVLRLVRRTVLSAIRGAGWCDLTVLLDSLLLRVASGQANQLSERRPQAHASSRGRGCAGSPINISGSCSSYRRGQTELSTVEPCRIPIAGASRALSLWGDVRR